MACGLGRGKAVIHGNRIQKKDLEVNHMSNTVKKITTIGMLLAIQVVLGRFVAISLPTVKISFTFLPIVITAMLYGPLWGGAAAVMGDFLIAILGPYGYYPPMAITALLTGIMYGLFLYRKPTSTLRVCVCIVLQSVLLSVLLQTYWLTLLTGKGFMVLVPARLLQNLVTAPVQIVCVRFIAYKVCDLIQYGRMAKPSTDK